MAVFSEAEVSAIKQHPLDDLFQTMRALFERLELTSLGLTEFLKTAGE
jgi:hypothetical protein